MNLIDCTVTKVLSEPIHKQWGDLEAWLVHIEYESWGRTSETVLSFPTLEEAEAVKIGHTFLA